MKLSQHRASREFVSNCHLGQTLRWRYIPTPPSPPPAPRRHIPNSPSFSSLTDIRSEVWWYQRLQSAFLFSLRGETKGGRVRRRKSNLRFDCFSLRSYTAGLHAQLQTATFFLPSFTRRCDPHPVPRWKQRDAVRTQMCRRAMIKKKPIPSAFVPTLVSSKFWLGCVNSTQAPGLI